MTEYSSEILSAFVDGDLPEEERTRVAAAIAQHPELAEHVRELEALKALSSDAMPTGPTRDLWPAIRAELARPSVWTRIYEWWSAPRLGWAMAGALATALVLVLMRPPPVPIVTPTSLATELAAAQQTYRSAISRLEDQSDEKVKLLPEETRVALRSSMAEVDAAIAKAERALKQAPEDPFAHECLIALYDEKIRILRATIDASRIGETS